jgi:hypothetical protein
VDIDVQSAYRTITSVPKKKKLKRAGTKALPPFQLIKEKRTRVQGTEYKLQLLSQHQITQTLGPGKGPKPCLGFN